MGANDVAVGRVDLSTVVHNSRAAEALGTELQAGVGEAPNSAGGLTCLNGAGRYGHGSVEGTGRRAVRVTAQACPAQRGRDSAVAVVRLTPAATVVGVAAAPAELGAAVSKGTARTGGGAVVGSADTGGRDR